MAADNSGDIPSVECNLDQPAVLSVGEHTINCVATDAAGNQATCSFEVTVKGKNLHLYFVKRLGRMFAFCYTTAVDI